MFYNISYKFDGLKTNFTVYIFLNIILMNPNVIQNIIDPGRYKLTSVAKVYFIGKSNNVDFNIHSNSNLN